MLQITNLFGGTEALTQAKELARNSRSRQAVEQLIELYEALRAYGVEKYVSFDLGMLSKYNYYTGVIFKAYAYGVGDAIVKGGRYDTLLARFGKSAPAIGFVIVIDDLMSALTRQKVEVSVPQKAVILEYTNDTYRETLKKALEMRSNGIKTILRKV